MPTSFLINSDRLVKEIGHPPLPGADLSAFAQGKTVTDDEIHRVFGFANHGPLGKKVDLAPLLAMGSISVPSPAAPVAPAPTPAPAPVQPVSPPAPPSV